MGDEVFRCRNCKELRLKRTPEQRYCSREACQKARKNAWRRAKLELDPDYRANQQASTRAWLASQGGSSAYYQRYRNQRRQRAPCVDSDNHRARQVSTPVVVAAGANSDAKSPQVPVISGRYGLLRCDAANSDAILVELSVVRLA
jgi:hypothetical protein